MSLWVCLMEESESKTCICSCGHEHEPKMPKEPVEVYSANITHNLARMANAADIYEALWCPEDVGFTKAKQLIEPLTKGLELMRSDPAKFKAFNSPNGWGLYENFVPWVARYLRACEEYPEARISVSR